MLESTTVEDWFSSPNRQKYLADLLEVFLNLTDNGSHPRVSPIISNEGSGPLILTINLTH